MLYAVHYTLYTIIVIVIVVDFSENVNRRWIIVTSTLQNVCEIINALMHFILIILMNGFTSYTIYTRK